MKKIAFILGIAVMTFSVACGGEGAYSEDEKKEQDSSDNVRHEDEFEKMEKQMKEDSSGTTKVDANVVQPGKGEVVPAQVAPPQPPPPSSELQTEAK